MKFNIWTFAFQVINFTVLLFILKRVLYRPVKEIMDKRRKLIAKTLEDAEKTKSEAEELRKKNQEELQSIKEMRAHMTETMKTEIAEERNRLLAGAEAEAGKIIERDKALFEMELSRTRTELKAHAIKAVSMYASELFRDISDKKLHDAVFRKVKDDIGRIAAGIQERNTGDKVVAVELTTAYPTEKETLEELRELLEKESNARVELHEEIDKELLAGVRLKTYDMVYDISLAGQILAFSTSLREKT